MKRVLLIYNLVPEDLKVYLLEVDEATLTRLSVLHGSYWGTGKGSVEDCDWLNGVILADKTPVYRDAVGDIPPIPHENLDAIVITGFLL